MAIGDEAAAQGYPLVPNTGEEGKVKYGAREINRTRDMVAGLRWKVASYGYDSPNNVNGEQGDMYFQVKL